nr:translation initiation factor IF-2-like [Aegilops tauschii subsp. strangulata]
MPSSPPAHGPLGRQPAQVPAVPSAAQGAANPLIRAARAAPDHGTHATGTASSSGPPTPGQSPAAAARVTAPAGAPGVTTGENPGGAAGCGAVGAGTATTAGRRRGGRAGTRPLRDDGRPLRRAGRAAARKSPRSGGASNTGNSTRPSPSSSSAQSAHDCER